MLSFGGVLDRFENKGILGKDIILLQTFLLTFLQGGRFWTIMDDYGRIWSILDAAPR